jgi:hypothetical protein
MTSQPIAYRLSLIAGVKPGRSRSAISDRVAPQQPPLTGGIKATIVFAQTMAALDVLAIHGERDRSTQRRQLG